MEARLQTETEFPRRKTITVKAQHGFARQIQHPFKDRVSDTDHWCSKTESSVSFRTWSN
jgi:hypothetical protein